MPVSPTACLGERVDEQDHVGVALGMALVHPHLAAARGRAPVHALQRVAGRPRPHVRELDPFALAARDLAAREHLRLARLQDPSQCVFARIDANLRRPREHPLGDEQAERVAGAEVDRAELMGAPALCAQRQLQLAPLAAREPQAVRTLAVRDL